MELKDLYSAINDRRWQIDVTRKRAAVDQLWELYRNDTTVHTFLASWQQGGFASFEDMLCQLAAQLAVEKAEYMRTATKIIHVVQAPQFIVTDERNL